MQAVSKILNNNYNAVLSVCFSSLTISIKYNFQDILPFTF